MGCLVSCIACNAASCLCSGLCKCCGRAVPMKFIAGRIAYTIIFFIVSFVAWIFRSWAEKILKWVPVLNETCAQQQVCYGTFAVYRISFCLALFHAVLAIIMIGANKRGDCRTQLQDGFWGVKIFLLLGATVGVFFIPNEFFAYYGWVALVASGFFILAQLILLVDFAHSWAENWISKHEEAEVEEDNRWWYFMLGASIVMFLGGVGLTLTMYILFNNCGLNVAFVTINILLCILISAGSIHPKVQEANPSSGLLQPALVSLYSTYLIFSAIQSEDDGCNSLRSVTGASNTALLIGALFTICAVCYATFRASTKIVSIGSIDSEKTSLLSDQETGETSTEEHKEGHKEKHHKDDEEEEDHVDPDDPAPYNYCTYHIVYALGAMYISMLMTDWQTVYNPGESSNSLPTVDSGLAAVWVKVVSSWICLCLYIWTLAGPIFFPDRDWKPSAS